jgi:hypothetical protein
MIGGCVFDPVFRNRFQDLPVWAMGSRGFIPLFAIQEIKLKRNSKLFALHIMSDDFLHGAFSKEYK